MTSDQTPSESYITDCQHQDSEQEACAYPDDEGETTLKSFQDKVPSDSLNYDNSASLEETVSHPEDLNVKMRPTQQPASALGNVSTPGQENPDLVGMADDQSQDIALRFNRLQPFQAHIMQAPASNNPVATSTSVRSRCQPDPPQTEPQQRVPSALGSQDGFVNTDAQINASTMDAGDDSRWTMNIPLSLSEASINNTAMAENQVSFRTLNSDLSNGPDALHPKIGQVPVEGSNADYQLNNGLFSLVSQPTQRNNLPNGPEMNQLNSIIDHSNGFSNASNASVVRGATCHCQKDTASATISEESLTSNRSWMSKFDTTIDDKTPVRQLSRKFLKFLSSRLENPNSSNWKDLVELHGWNYERTQYFAREKREDGPFLSLIMDIDDFAHYSVQNLKDDLRILPRKDVLYEFDKMVEKFNETINKPSP